VRRIIRLDSQTSNFYGKTGSGRINDVTTIGWFVGAVEKDGKRFIFATNITGSQDATGIKARAIATDILKASGIL
jgi:bla regulator protein BlaR1